MLRSLKSVEIQVTGLVYMAIFLNFFIVGSIVPLLPRLMKDHGMTDSDLSVILSSKSFMHMAASPFLAVLSSEIRPETLFSFGVFAVAGAYFGIGLSNDLTGFVIARLVQGIGIASIMVAGMSLLIKCVPKEKRGRYTSFAYSALGHSTLLAPVLSGVMYDYLGQVWTFLIPGIITGVCGVLSILTFARIRRMELVMRHSGTLSGTQLDLKAIFPALKGIVKTPLAFAAYVGIFSSGASFGSCEGTLPTILAEWDGGIPVLKANLIWSVGPLTFTILAPIIGYLIDVIGPAWVFAIGQLMYPIFYPVFYLMAETLEGLGGVIAVAFAIQAFMELSVYPLVASIIDSIGIPGALPIGYSLNEVFLQGGYATGNILGVVLITWKGLRYMGLIIGGWDGFLFLTTVTLLLVLKCRNSSRTMSLEQNQNTTGADNQSR